MDKKIDGKEANDEKKEKDIIKTFKIRLRKCFSLLWKAFSYLDSASVLEARKYLDKLRLDVEKAKQDGEIEEKRNWILPILIFILVFFIGWQIQKMGFAAGIMSPIVWFCWNILLLLIAIAIYIFLILT